MVWKLLFFSSGTHISVGNRQIQNFLWNSHSLGYLESFCRRNCPYFKNSWICDLSKFVRAQKPWFYQIFTDFLCKFGKKSKISPKSQKNQHLLIFIKIPSTDLLRSVWTSFHINIIKNDPFFMILWYFELERWNDFLKIFCFFLLFQNSL